VIVVQCASLWGHMTEAEKMMSTNIGDQTWRDQVATMDEVTLRMLVAHVKTQQRIMASRRQYVEMMLDLLPEHQCNCNKRWTTGDVPHDKGCERLKACTCERQWIGGGLFVTDHNPDCEIRRNWVPVQPRATEQGEPEDDLKICATCGDEVDADDVGCPDDGGGDPS